MKKLFEKLLCLIMSITMFIGVIPPMQVIATDWDEEPSIDIDLSDFNDTFSDFVNVTTADVKDAKLDDIQRDIASISKALKSGSSLMTGIQYISYSVSAINGIVTVLRTLGIIEDPTQTALNSILDAVKDIKAEVEEINKKVTVLQETLRHEFSNTEYLQKIQYAQGLQDRWSAFMTGEYKKMMDLSYDYEEQTNKSGISWAKTWKNSVKTDLRSLYNADGILLYNGDNFEGFNKELPVAPGCAEDAKRTDFDSDVAFEIVLPAEYLSVDGKITINADNYVEIIRNAVGTAVKKAVEDGTIKVDATVLSKWKVDNSQDKIVAKISDDMVNSIFYEISSQIANSDVDGTSFSNSVLSAYKGFCSALFKSNNKNSVFDDMLEYLSIIYVFEGEAKPYAVQHLALLGTAIVEFGTLTSTLVAITPSIKTSAKTELADLINYTLFNTKETYKSFANRKDNYCFALNGELSYVDVSVQSVIKSHNNINDAQDCAEKCDDYSDWALVDASTNFDTEDLDAYKFETKRNEAVLKNSMVSIRNLEYLFHYINTSKAGKSIMDYLRDNSVITSDGKHSTELVTPEFEIKDHKIDKALYKCLPYANDDDKGKDTRYDNSPLPGYEEGKTVKPLTEYRTKNKLHDKLIGTTFSIDGNVSDGTDIASREKTEQTLSVRILQYREYGYAGPHYFLYDDSQNVSLSLSDDASDPKKGLKRQAAYRNIYTLKSEKSYGALVINYNKNADPCSYNETIKDKDGLVRFLKNIAGGNTYEGKHIKLMNDIDMTGVNPESYWPNSEIKREFKGHFNGNNKTIKNFTFDSTDHRVALFRTTGSGALIENLKFTDVNIGKTGSKNGYATLVGYANGNLTVKNVEIVSGTVSGYKYVGGIVGESNENIKLNLYNCTNNAVVTSRDVDAGGMMGNVGKFFAYGCINNGKVTAMRGGAGGVAGYHNKIASVKNCTNTGEIIGYDCAGGMCGRIEHNSKYAHYIGNKNTADITATTKGSAGGIVGWTDGAGAFTDNLNSGAVVCTATEKTHCAGGILGGNEDDPISFKNNKNSGSVKSNDRTGGIAGYLGDKDHDEIVIAVYNSNSGTVVATGRDAGGIIGSLVTDNVNHDISNNYNTGSITGKACTGGIIGWMAGGGMFISNTNRADILSQENSAGGIVGVIEDDKCEFKKSNVEGQTIVGNQRVILDAEYIIKTKNSDKRAGKICGWDGKRKTTINSDTLFATIFGQGNVAIIVIMSVLLVAAAVVTVVVYKKKKKAGQAVEMK